MKHDQAHWRKCKCGRFVGDPVCQCRVQQVRRDMIQGDNIQELLKLAEPCRMRPELMVAEVCYVE